MSRATDIEAQAATWLARRDARSGAEYDTEFASWLAADPRHRAAYLRLAEAWRRSERLQLLRPADGAVNADLLAPGLIRSSRFHQSLRTIGWRWTAMAAAVVFAVLAFALSWTTIVPSSHTYSTGADGLSQVLLQDGSLITLNSETEVQVKFSRRLRSVILSHGEALFTVAHDAHRPFEVTASRRIVLAVGTAFDVRLSAGRAMEVIVTEGRVALFGASNGTPQLEAIPPPTISAGESAVATSGRLIVRDVLPEEVDRRLAWERRELSFQGETLQMAVAEFNRFNSRKLVIDDSSIQSLHIGGNFQALDIESFVLALERSFGISAEKHEDGTIHLSRTVPP